MTGWPARSTGSMAELVRGDRSCALVQHRRGGEDVPGGAARLANRPSGGEAPNAKQSRTTAPMTTVGTTSTVQQTPLRRNERPRPIGCPSVAPDHVQPEEPVTRRAAVPPLEDAPDEAADDQGPDQQERRSGPRPRCAGRGSLRAPFGPQREPYRPGTPSAEACPPGGHGVPGRARSRTSRAVAPEPVAFGVDSWDRRVLADGAVRHDGTSMVPDEPPAHGDRGATAPRSTCAASEHARFAWCALAVCARVPGVPAVLEAVLIGLVTVQISFIVTTVYLHRAMAHKAITCGHPSPSPAGSSSGCRRGHDPANGWRCTASTTPTPTRRATRTRR